MGRVTTKIRPGACDNRYVVVYSDDGEKWMIEFGKVVHGYSLGPDLRESDPIRRAPSPAQAIQGLHAPEGRVFRVLDIDDGEVHEFVVRHCAGGCQ